MSDGRKFLGSVRGAKQVKGRAPSNLPSGSFIALGGGPQSSSVGGLSSLKREGAASIGPLSVGGAAGGPLPKKTKLDPVQSSAGSLLQPVSSDRGLRGNSPSAIAATGLPASRFESLVREDAWRRIATESAPILLTRHVDLAVSEDAESQPNKESDGLICGAVQRIHDNRSKDPPDPIVCCALSTMARSRPALFRSQHVLEAVCCLIRRPTQKTTLRSQTLNASFGAGLLYAIYKDEDRWPELFVKIFLEDSLNERLWVDRADCRPFVLSIVKAFRSRQIPFGVYQVVSQLKTGDSVADFSLVSDESGEQVPNRFTESQDSVRSHALLLLRECWGRRIETVNRGVLKTMAVMCGYDEVKMAAVQRLDSWIQNPKLQRFALELLAAVCINCSPADVEILSLLSRLRLKKPALQFFMNCFKEIMAADRTMMQVVLEIAVKNELSQTRTQHNMLLISQAFAVDFNVAGMVLASIVRGLFLHVDDYLKSLRILLREIIRTLRYEFPLAPFLSKLLSANPEVARHDVKLRHRYFHAAIDIYWLVIYACVSTGIREAATLSIKGEKREMGVFKEFHKQVSSSMSIAVEWLRSAVPSDGIELSHEEYARAYHRVLFLDKAETYGGKDGWPHESERGFLHKLVERAPIAEEVVNRVLLAAFDPKVSLTLADGIDLCDQLVRRMALIFRDTSDVQIKISRLDVIDLLFNCCIFHKEDHTLLADATLYWKVLNVLLILSAYLPELIGRQAWDNYPTLRMMIEMTITNDYAFPPASAVSVALTADDIKNRDLQAAEIEKEEERALEDHLPMHRPQLMRLDPKGPARRPSQAIFSQLKFFGTECGLGIRFCRSRSPDFLLEIINRQGPGHSLPWLVDLIDSNEGSVDILPVQCLCEFMIHQVALAAEEDTAVAYERLAKYADLEERLASGIWSSERGQEPSLEAAGPSVSSEIDNIFPHYLTRLQSDTEVARSTALMGLKSLLNRRPSTLAAAEPDRTVPASMIEPFYWLFVGLPSLPQFPRFLPSIYSALTKALVVETRPSYVAAYVQFLLAFSQSCLESLSDLVEHLAVLLVKRAMIWDTVVQHPLAEKWRVGEAACEFFYRFVDMKRQTCDEVVEWSSDTDALMLEWPSENKRLCIEQITLEAMIIALLSCSDEMLDDVMSKAYDLFRLFFPRSTKPPKAQTLDTFEEVDFFSSRLKLKTLQTGPTILVDEAIAAADCAELLDMLKLYGLEKEAVRSICKRLLVLLPSTEDASLLDDVFPKLEGRVKYYAEELNIQQAEELLPYFPTVSGEEESAIEAGQYVLSMDDGEMAVADVAMKEPSSTRDEVLQFLYGNSYAAPSLSAAVIGLSAQERSEILDRLIEDMSSKQNRREKFKNFCEAASTKTVFLKLVFQLKSTEQGVKEKHEKLCRTILAVCHNKSNVMHQYAQNSLRHTRGPMDLDAKPVGVVSAAGKIAQNAIGQSETDQNAIGQSETDQDGALKLENLSIAASQLIDLLSESSVSAQNWIQIVDPDTAKVEPEKQLDVLFGADANRAKRSSKRINSNFSPGASLLPVLMNNATNRVLESTLSQLLSGFDEKKDPERVLDFVTAFAHLPKVWRGRERSVPRQSPQENVLNLTRENVVNLLRYVIAAAAAAKPSASASSSEVGASSPNGVPFSRPEPSFVEPPHSASQEAVVIGRMPLILHILKCASESAAEHVLDDCSFKSLLSSLVEELMADMQQDRLRHVAKMALFELYLHIPAAKDAMKDVAGVFADVDAVNHSGCAKIDRLLKHMILDLFALCKSTADDGIGVVDASIHPALLRFAAFHPWIFVRQLPLLASLLRGTTTKRVRELYRVSSLMLFIASCLEYVEQMEAVLFSKHYLPALRDFFVSFFAFVEVHGLRNPKFISLVDRLMKLLLAFNAADGDAAAAFLKDFTELMQNISTRYPNLLSVRNLIAEVALPLPPIALANVGDDEPGGTEAFDLRPVFTRPTSPTQPEQVVRLLGRFTGSMSYVDTLQALSDVGEQADKKPDCLPYFRDVLADLLVNEHAHVRQQAILLIDKLLRRTPKQIAYFEPPIRSCLQHSSADISSAVFDSLPKLMSCSTEANRQIMEDCFLRALSLPTSQAERVLSSVVKRMTYDVDLIESAKPSAGR